MFKTIVLSIALMIFISSEAQAGLGYVGTLDSQKENFYYTGLDAYVWSFRKAKQYKDKFKMIFKYNFEDKEAKIVEKRKNRGQVYAFDKKMFCKMKV